MFLPVRIMACSPNLHPLWCSKIMCQRVLCAGSADKECNVLYLPSKWVRPSYSFIGPGNDRGPKEYKKANAKYICRNIRTPLIIREKVRFLRISLPSHLRCDRLKGARGRAQISNSQKVNCWWYVKAEDDQDAERSERLQPSASTQYHPHPVTAQ